MANIFDKDIYYITAQEVKDTTDKTDLKALDDDDINILIAKAEISVNNYLWYTFWADIVNKTEETQLDIKIATFYIVEQIFTNSDLVKKVNINWVVSSESSWDRSIAFKSWTQINDLKILWINEFAKKILDKYKQIFFKQII